MVAFEWMPPVKPHLSMLGLERDGSLLFIALVYCAYTAYMMATCIWLHVRRDHYLLQKSPTRIALWAAMMQFVLVSSHVLRFLYFHHLPAPLVIWRNFVFFPLFILCSFQARGMDLIFELIWTRSIDEGPDYGEDGLYISIEKRRLMRERAPWWEKLFCRVRDPRFLCMLKNHGTVIMTGGLAILHVTGAALLHWLALGCWWTVQECPFVLDAAGVALTLGFYLVLWCPLMLGVLVPLRDVYGMRRDLQLACSYGLPCYLLYIVMRAYPFLQPLRKHIPSFLFMLAAMVVVHTATVTWPLIRTVFWVPQELNPALLEEKRLQRVSDVDLVGRPTPTVSVVIPHRPIPLELVLEHPALLSSFAAYCRNAFVWDSVLFHRAIRRFHLVCQDRSLPSESDSPPEEIHFTIHQYSEFYCHSPESLKDDLSSILEADKDNADPVVKEARLIYRQYIAPGAPCEMNLHYETVIRIKQRLQQHDYSEDLFDRAHQEVLRLVGDCTYRNFLSRLDVASRARYMVPYGDFLTEGHLDAPAINPHRRFSSLEAGP